MPSESLDRVEVSFDHEHTVADAGLLSTGSLVGRLGLEQLIDDTVTLGFRPGRRLLTLAHTLVADGGCIEVGPGMSHDVDDRALHRRDGYSCTCGPVPLTDRSGVDRDPGAAACAVVK